MSSKQIFHWILLLLNLTVIVFFAIVFISLIFILIKSTFFGYEGPLPWPTVKYVIISLGVLIIPMVLSRFYAGLRAIAGRKEKKYSSRNSKFIINSKPILMVWEKRYFLLLALQVFILVGGIIDLISELSYVDSSGSGPLPGNVVRSIYYITLVAFITIMVPIIVVTYQSGLVREKFDGNKKKV